MSWETVKLSEFCVSIADGDHLPPPKAESGIPFVTISNINAMNQIDFTNTMFVPQEYYDRLDSKRKAQVGDVLYSVVGSFGIPVYIKENQKFVFQRHIAILRSNGKILPRFLYYTMLSRDFYAKADAAAIGAAQRTLSLTALRNIEIDIPTIEEQNKIVDILSAYDDLIENNKKQIKLMEEAAQRLYKEWFVDLRFPGHENTPIVDGVPKGWRKISLCDIAPIITGKKDANFGTKDGAYPFFTCSQEPIKSPSYSFDTSAIILAGNGDFNVKLYRGKFEAYQRTYVLSPIEEKYLYLLYNAVNENMAVLVKGASGSTIKFLTKGMIENIPLFTPTDELLAQYNNCSEAVQRKMECLKMKIKNATEARDRLLPKLMNGELME